MALPGLPSNDTHVYTIELKIIEQKIVISTNNTGDSTPAFRINKSPTDTMSACNIPSIIKNPALPKNTCLVVNTGSKLLCLLSTVNKLTIKSAPTHTDNAV